MNSQIYCVGCNGMKKAKYCPNAQKNGQTIDLCKICAKEQHFSIAGYLRDSCPIHPYEKLYHAQKMEVIAA